MNDDLFSRLDAHLCPPGEAGEAIAILPVPATACAAVIDKLEGMQARWARQQGFGGKAGDVLLLPDATGAVGSVLVGLGAVDAKAAAEDGEVALAAGALAQRLPAGCYRFDTRHAPWLDEHLLVLGWMLSAYRYRFDDNGADASPAGEAQRRARLVLPARFEPLRAQAAAIWMGRDLINTPANALGPAQLAERAQALAEEHGARFAQVQGEDLQEGFPLIHAVGRGAEAARAPRLIDLRWGDAGPRVTLVGKGVCFDSGGLDIKPSNAMLLMKKDMGGAAAALSCARMVMAAGLPVRLRVLIAAVENAVSGAAFRPGDVFTSRAGLTVEIGNTDAEGRLVLADALALADEEQPDLLVDFATLTGAARVALGPDLPPVFSPDPQLAALAHDEGVRLADPVWPMPLFQPYMKGLESSLADLNNVTSNGFAGAITAALFLSRFVQRARHWLHFDIYGWVPNARPGRPKGGEPQAARLVFHLIREHFGA